MDSQHNPDLPVNSPPPRGLLSRYRYSEQMRETPPQLIQIDDHLAIDRLETMELQSMARVVDPEIANRNTAKYLFVPPPHIVNREQDISSFRTTLLPSSNIEIPRGLADQNANQLMYANTAYARRLERRLRIEEKKLSWKDLQQFSRFVTPFKWQIALVFFLLGFGLFFRVLLSFQFF